MPNPWLEIPADDYVGHMASPEVGQHQALNRILRDLLLGVRPGSVLALGCSTGNGLEHVDPSVTSRVVGVDVNPVYLERLRQRFPRPAFTLETHCADLTAYEFETGAFDLIHAALVFEYVEWPRLLGRVAAALRAGGVLSVVLQRPSSSSPVVTPTAFTSLRSLEAIFGFVVPGVLVTEAAAHGLAVDSRRPEPLPSGKAFEVLRFTKPG
jgi:SAM-dependent methyltransferase